MRAVVAERPGPAREVLAVREVADPGEPGAGEVLVSMRATTVNPSDLITIQGAYGSRTRFPFVPGFEGIGVVASVGEGVTADLVGRRVLPLGSPGAWQEVKVSAAAWCVPVPDDLPDEVACFAYINPVTAWLMVERFVTSGTRYVAVTAARSVIAGHLAELLRLRGIEPIGLVRGAARMPAASGPSLFGELISTDEPGWPDHLGEATGGQGLDVVFDAVGGPLGVPLMAALRRGGTLVHYGLLSGVPLPMSHLADHPDRSVEFFRLRDVVHGLPERQRASLLAPVFDHLRHGRLTTAIAAHYGLADLPGRAGVREGLPGKALVRVGDGVPFVAPAAGHA